MTAPQTSGYLQANDPTKPRSDAAIPFRDLIPHHTHPRIAGIENHNALSWCESRRQIEAPAWLINRLDAKNLEVPYKGFTTDGKVKEGVYNYAEDEGAPTEEVMGKVKELLELLNEEERQAVQSGEVTDDQFRIWSNPELYVNPGNISYSLILVYIVNKFKVEYDLMKAPQSSKTLFTQFSNPHSLPPATKKY